MSDRILVATRKGLFTIERAGKGGTTRWGVSRTAFIGDNLPIVAHDPRDGLIYAALNHGHFGSKVHRSADGGTTWEEVAAPTYPEMPPGAEPEKDGFGKLWPWKLELIWCIAPGGRDEPGTLWCGTIPGGLFRSANRGESWTMVRSLWDEPRRKQWFGGGADMPGIHSVLIDPRDSCRVTVGVSCGGVWLSSDRGDSWSLGKGMRAAYMPPEQQHDPAIQDPHIVVQCEKRPESLWAQHHNGIFRSTDGGASWSEITDVKPSTFGFAVAVHPHDPETAWFVPAISDERRTTVDGRVVVTRTRDGGKSFDILSRGLPDRFAYDIVFRHCLDIDESGDRLAFGSTTGSLWVTEDQGDSWQCVTNHLPPIYCVRFVKP